MHQENIVTAGKEITSKSKVLIMVHGRGGSAGDIISLAPHLHVKDFALLAPQATNNSWYPLSFLAPPMQNEPFLSSALARIKEVVDEVLNKGVPTENIYFCGFSQGACLTLEYVTRHATTYGGVAAFTGGLIGDKIYTKNYNGDFGNTPVFIGTSNPDAHVPVERVYATSNVLKDMNAAVTVKVYDNMSHTINYDEIEQVNQLIFGKASI